MYNGSEINRIRRDYVMLETILGTKKPCQIGMIVKDVEASKQKVAQLYGLAVPPTVDSGDYAITKTLYKGQPAPDANCKMAFFDFDNIQLELIEPNQFDSTWRDHLVQVGEGMHHLGFIVDDIFKRMEMMKEAGYELTQFGYYGSGNGAYAYFDCTKDVKCYVELLCNF